MRDSQKLSKTMLSQSDVKSSRKSAHRTGNRHAPKELYVEAATLDGLTALPNVEALSIVREYVKPDCIIGDDDSSNGEFPTLADVCNRLHAINRLELKSLDGSTIVVPTFGKVTNRKAAIDTTERQKSAMAKIEARKAAMVKAQEAAKAAAQKTEKAAK